MGPGLDKKTKTNFDIDYVLLEHGGLPLVLPLAVHLEFLCRMGRGDHSKTVLLFGFCCEKSPSGLKLRGWWWVAYSILVSAPVPLGLDLIGTWLGLVLRGFGTKGFGTGLNNNKHH